MKVMFKPLFLFALLVMLPCSACSEQTLTPEADIGPNTYNAGGPGSGRQEGRPSGPPPEAYEACEGKTTGSSAQFKTPRGNTITGTCEEKDGKLFLRPDRPKGDFGVRPQGPPPEAYKACEGKSAGSSAQFTDPRGETITGTCEEKDGKLVLRPDRFKGDSGNRRPGPPPEAFKACEGKAVGSPAQLEDHLGNIVKGTCEKEGERLFLRPDWLKSNERMERGR